MSDEDDIEGLRAWDEMRRNDEWSHPYPMVEMRGIDPQLIKDELQCAHQHITEAERANLWQRYQRLHKVNEKCPRPDGNSD